MTARPLHRIVRESADAYEAAKKINSVMRAFDFIRTSPGEEFGYIEGATTNPTHGRIARDSDDRRLTLFQLHR